MILALETSCDDTCAAVVTGDGEEAFELFVDEAQCETRDAANSSANPASRVQCG